VLLERTAHNNNAKVAHGQTRKECKHDMLSIEVFEESDEYDVSGHCLVCCEEAVGVPLLLYVVTGEIGGSWGGDSLLTSRGHIDRLLTGFHGNDGVGAAGLCANVARHWLVVERVATRGSCPHCGYDADVPVELRLRVRDEAAEPQGYTDVLQFGVWCEEHVATLLNAGGQAERRYSVEQNAARLREAEQRVNSLPSDRIVHPHQEVGEVLFPELIRSTWSSGGLMAEVMTVLDTCQRVIARSVDGTVLPDLADPESIQRAIEERKFLPSGVSDAEGTMIINGVVISVADAVGGTNTDPLRENVRYHRQSLAAAEEELHSAVAAYEQALRDPRVSMRDVIDEVLDWHSVLRVDAEPPFIGAPTVRFRPVVFETPKQGRHGSDRIHYLVTTPIACNVRTRVVRTTAHPHCTLTNGACWGEWSQARDRARQPLEILRIVESWRLGVDWTNAYSMPLALGSSCFKNYLEEPGVYTIVQAAWDGKLVRLADLWEARKEDTDGSLLLPTAF
jgi:hypothetical protein